MTPRFAAVVVTCVLLAAVAGAQDAPKPPVDVKADTTWTGEVTVDSVVRVSGATLTVAPGAKVTFFPGGSIALGGGGSLVTQGTKENPVEFIGGKAGQITGSPKKLLLERCKISAMGGRYWLQVTAGAEGVTLRDSEISDSPGVSVTLAGPFEVTRCRVVNGGEGFSCQGKGKATYSDNVFIGCGFSVIGSDADGVVTGNVVLRGTISGWQKAALLVENNYVHQPGPNGSFGLLHVVGTIRNNVIRGGTWVTASLGGEITHNVLISLPHEGESKKEGGYDKNCTHEHIEGLRPDALVARNIFVGASYAAVMGIGEDDATDAIIRNNTFDMRGAGQAVNLDHLVKAKPKNIIIRSNVFIRAGSIFNQDGAPDITSVVDYNLWAASGLGKAGRFEKITMAGKTAGEGDFGGHDVPPWAKRTEPLNPADVVVNPDIEFPFSDDDMIARKHTVAEVLKFYRDAYSLKSGSPAIDAGDPADKDDPAVKDGKPDIGAIERMNP